MERRRADMGSPSKVNGPVREKENHAQKRRWQKGKAETWEMHKTETSWNPRNPGRIYSKRMVCRSTSRQLRWWKCGTSDCCPNHFHNFCPRGRFRLPCLPRGGQILLSIRKFKVVGFLFLPPSSPHCPLCPPSPFPPPPPLLLFPPPCPGLPARPGPLPLGRHRTQSTASRSALPPPPAAARGSFPLRFLAPPPWRGPPVCSPAGRCTQNTRLRCRTLPHCRPCACPPTHFFLPRIAALSPINQSSALLVLGPVATGEDTRQPSGFQTHSVGLHPLVMRRREHQF